MTTRMHVKKDDTVIVTAGKDKGKSGKVLRVFTEKGHVIVENLNMIKRHKRATQTNPDAGIIEKEASLDASNVMLVCSACSKPARTGIRVLDDGSKVRYCKKCDAVVDK